MQTNRIIKRYYDSFNQSAMEEFLALLTEDVVHDINQNGQEIGKEKFRIFMERMNRHYKERVTDLVVFSNQEGTRAAAEFFIEGTYLTTDVSLPAAKGQKYRIRCGAFFELRGDLICRVTNYYNLNEWLSKVK